MRTYRYGSIMQMKQGDLYIVGDRIRGTLGDVDRPSE